MYKVTYTIKTKDGYLVDKSKTYDSFQDAVAFIRNGKTPNQVGKPIIERIGK